MNRYVIIKSVKQGKLETFNSHYRELLKKAKFPVSAKLKEVPRFLDPQEWLEWIPDCDKSIHDEAWWSLSDFNWSYMDNSLKYLL